MELTQIKQTLYEECIAYVNRRIDTIQQAIMSAKEAADEETKNSTGDKYETGRAMMQIEIENQVIQLKEAQRLFDDIRMIRPAKHTDDAQAGSLVVTNLGSYYLAIGAGKISVDDKDYFAVALSSPVGQQLLGKKNGDKFELNGRKYEIQSVI